MVPASPARTTKPRMSLCKLQAYVEPRQMHDSEQTFELLVDRRYRRDDGSRWTGAALERASGGEVTRGYVSELRRGRVKEPSFEKISEISRAIGASLDEWLEEDEEGREG